MFKKSFYLFSVLVAAAFVFGLVFQNKDEKPLIPAVSQENIKQKIAEEYGKLPLNFEPNLGQTDDQVKFLARGDGYSLFLTEREAVLSLQKHGKVNKSAVVRMQIEGAKNAPKISGTDETAGKSNYFIGNDQTKWQAEIPNYEKVRYESIYDGVDLVYYGNNQQLEYDFHVQPKADPKQIKLNFDGIKSAKIEKQTGDLLLETNAGTIRQHKPLVYQNIDGERREIASSYSLLEDRKSFSVGFSLAEYDRSKELIIDPILAYGSYLGGNAFDEGRSVTVDANGNAYVVGTAASRNFPTTSGTIKPAMLPATNANQFWYDAFVTKINPTGTAIVFSTYFGGRNGSETGSGVAVDALGNILISGTTMASDFPTVNAYQTTFGGTDDAFAAKLNSSGSAIIYSTYLGGNNTDTGGKIALSSNGDAIFAGTASSPNFPTTAGAYKQKLCDTPQTCSGIFYSGSYVVRLSANGAAIYSTLFDATVNDVATDTDGNAVLGGSVGGNLPTTSGAFQPASSGGIDGFVAKLNPSGNAVVFGTYLGGGLQSDRVKSIALDAAQNIYVTGQTQNTAFPTTSGAFDQTYNGGEDGFVTKFNPSGSALVYSTFLGGTGRDEPFGIALGADNSAFITGETIGATSFPLRNSLNGTRGTIFLTRLNENASALIFSTMLGQGGGYDVAADSSNNAYVTGSTTSGIIVTPNAFQTVKGGDISDKDGYIIKISPTDENQSFYSISGMVTDENAGYNNDYTPIVATVTGTVSRSINLPYSGGQYVFDNLPAGGNYTITIRKIGYVTSPESETFNNLGANQSADFRLLRNHAPEAIITSPAHGTTFNSPASITITATATDEDGDAIQKMDFQAYSSAGGTINLGTDTTAPYEFTWNNVPVGTWVLYAVPFDAKGLRGQTQNVVHVFVVDASPVSVSIASPTEGQTFVEGDYVPIGVNVSSSVNLVQVRNENNELVGWLTGSPWTTTWRVMSIGTHTLTATAQNSQGQTAVSAPVNITVNRINHRISGKVIDNITNAPISNVTVNLVSPSNPNITASATTDSAGDYVFTGLGTTPDDSVTITPVLSGYTFDPPTRSIGFLGYVTNWENQTFIATRQTGISVNLTNPTNGQIFTAPANFNLAATASTTSGTITKVEFYRRNNASSITLLSTDTQAPYEFNVSNLAAGNYAYFARATDSTGGVLDSQTASITVNAPQTTVRLQGEITNPSGGWMQGITVVLSGTANGNPVNQTSVSNNFGAYGFFNLPSGGNYTITPQGTGNQTFTPPSFTVNNATQDAFDIDFVASAANQFPSVQINSPSNGATYTMPAAIPINVTATDADGSIAHLTVSAIGNSVSTTVGQSNNGTFNAPWQPNAPGTYTLWATARDNGGLQTSVSIQFTVNAPAPVSISGRIVNRDSEGIEGVTMEIFNYPITEENPTPAATATTDANGGYTLSGITTFNNYILKPKSLNHSFSPQQRTFINLAASQTQVDFTATLQVQRSDFDGDNQSDAAVWRGSTGVWYVNRSTDEGFSAIQFGGSQFGDVAVPGNYDGDRKTDIAVFRNGVWYVINSSNALVKTVQFGTEGDKPVAGDFDGDGKTDFAVWRPSTGVWYIQKSSDNGYDIRQFGLNGDVPLAGDFDGDGKTDLTIWRPSSGVWYVWQSTDGGYKIYQFGTNGDTPLIGDFDGDKLTDFTIFRPSTGVWYVNLSTNGNFKILQWGISTDMPTPGDFDKDGKTDFAVFRPAEGNWYIFKSSNNSYQILHFGANGDTPIPARY